MISKKQEEILNNIIKKYNLDLVLLFGSRANNTNRIDSDWDLAIYSKKKIDSKNYFEIISHIEGIYFKKIDLIIIDENIDILLAKKIFENPVILFEKEKGLFDELYVNSIYNYIDYMPLYKLEEEVVKNKLNAI